jgi:hypothetical protein
LGLHLGSQRVGGHSTRAKAIWPLKGVGVVCSQGYRCQIKDDEIGKDFQKSTLLSVGHQHPRTFEHITCPQLLLLGHELEK